ASLAFRSRAPGSGRLPMTVAYGTPWRYLGAPPRGVDRAILVGDGTTADLDRSDRGSRVGRRRGGPLDGVPDRDPGRERSIGDPGRDGPRVLAGRDGRRLRAGGGVGRDHRGPGHRPRRPAGTGRVPDRQVPGRRGAPGAAPI